MSQTPFRAVLTRSFEVNGRGTVLCVDIVDGAVKRGDRLAVPMQGGSTSVVPVLGVDFVDIDVGKPTFRSGIALTGRDVRSAEVAVGRELRGVGAISRT